MRTTTSGASSYHPGVFATSTADAAVHFLSDTVDFEFYNYLGGRMDGNPKGQLLLMINKLCSCLPIGVLKDGLFLSICVSSEGNLTIV